MGAKKKGKANKLAKMSEEERLRYLQHRAAIEEEARRRKEQLISTFLKNKLKREEGFSRLNMAKINQQWRQILRQIKCVELKLDLEDLIKWFDYTANKKNKMIEILLADLDEAESQHSRIQQCQMEAIDKLIRIHEQRISHLYKQYKMEKDELYSKANADLGDILNSYLFDEEHLQTILYRMNEIAEKKLAAITSAHYSKVDELRNNMLTELETLKFSRESQIEKIWQNFETILKQYWEQTEDRRRQYIILRDSDYENCKQIFENNQQINMTIDLITNLKEQLAKTIAINKEKILECKENRENSRKIFYSVKQQVDQEIEEDKKNLYYLNYISGKATEELKQILAKGEQILQLQSLCRKFETINEKICPEGHDKPQLTEEEEKNVQEQLKDYPGPLAKEICKDLHKLEEFWKRYNRALLEKEALGLHYNSLLKEQTQLKSDLKNYLSDYVVKRPESKISYANGVQMFRQRPSTSLPEERQYPFSVATCIEATQSPSIRQIIKAEMRKSA